MKELAVAERYIYSRLKTIASAHSWPLPQIAPFDLADGPDSVANIPIPVFYFRHVSAVDRNAVGPGPRLLTTVDYEIGVFHDANSFGASFPENSGATKVSLLSLLTAIDDAFQNYTPPIINTGLGGTVYSVERLYPIRVPERFGGKLYKRDGGVYRLAVEAD